MSSWRRLSGTWGGVLCLTLTRDQGQVETNGETKWDCRTGDVLMAVMGDLPVPAVGLVITYL